MNILSIIVKLQSFKIDTKRNDKEFPLKSQEINRIIAGHIFNHCLKPLHVDVHQPDILIKIELRHDYSYIMNNVILGAGGYPVGMGGKALLMLSGGIDSPVAGYLTLKRGVALLSASIFLHHHIQVNVLKKK